MLPSEATPEGSRGMLLKSEDLEAERVAKREEEEVLWLGGGWRGQLAGL